MTAPQPNPLPFTPAPASAPAARAEEVVAFDRAELGQILSLYGRMVAAGEWRDYALSFRREAASFAIFRRSAETPLYRIRKEPRLRDRQGAFSLSGGDGQVLKRGHELRQVLAVLQRKALRTVRE